MFAAVLGISLLILIKFQIFEMEFILLNTSEYYCLKKPHTNNKQTDSTTQNQNHKHKNPQFFTEQVFSCSWTFYCKPEPGVEI